MLSKISLLFFLMSSTFVTTSCVSSPSMISPAGHHVFYDSAMNDHNRAPASMSPPRMVVDGADHLDPVYLRTQADYYFSMGESQSLDGNGQKAIEYFKLVLLYDPNSAQVNLRLAAEYVKLGLVTEALDYAERAVQLNPKYTDARLLLGGLFSTLKVYDKAVLQYEEILKQEPDNTEAPMYIGAVYAEQKQYDKAIQYFEKLAKNPDYSTPHLVWYYIGRIRTEQVGKNYLKSAESAYKKALELKPDHLESVLALGQLYTRIEQEEKAITLYKNYQREHGPTPKLAELLAQSYLEQEKYNEAYEQFEILEQYSDDSLNAKVKMALVLIEQKKYTSAIVKLHEVLRQVPDSDKIRFYIAAIYEETKNPAEAVEHFSKIPTESQYFGEAIVHATYLLKQNHKSDVALGLVTKALEKRPDIPQLYAIYASLLDEKGEYKNAQMILEKGSLKFPDNVQLRFFLGTMSDRLGDKEKVVSYMNKVIEMDPNHVQGLNYLAFTYAESNKNLDEAEKLVRRALELDPNDGYVMDTLGWILYKKGKFQDSVKILEAAFKHQPNESIIAEHLGDAYNKNQLAEKARKMYQRAAESETDESKINEIRQKITALDTQELKRSDRKPAGAP